MDDQTAQAATLHTANDTEDISDIRTSTGIVITVVCDDISKNQNVSPKVAYPNPNLDMKLPPQP